MQIKRRIYRPDPDEEGVCIVELTVAGTTRQYVVDNPEFRKAVEAAGRLEER